MFFASNKPEERRKRTFKVVEALNHWMVVPPNSTLMVFTNPINPVPPMPATRKAFSELCRVKISEAVAPFT